MRLTSYLLDSQINASVEGGNSAGGNISIDPEFVVLNNSSISANEFGGPGGNITIVADNYFQSSDSLVSASSQLSNAGTITISSPDVDVSGGLISLSESYLNADTWVVEKCTARLGGIGSSFVQTAATAYHSPQEIYARLIPLG